MGVFDWTAGSWYTNSENKGVQTTGEKKHHAISAKMAQPVSNRDKPLVVQFTGRRNSCLLQLLQALQLLLTAVKHESKEYSFCGGGYIKVLPSGLDRAQLGGDDEYAISTLRACAQVSAC